jgi:hypothetical protein
MVHFPGFAPPRLWIQRGVRRFYQRGFPHSEIPGSMPACGSPRLIAACHVLLRLLLPRHPPCALSSLTIKFTPRIPSRTLRLPPSSLPPRHHAAASSRRTSGTLERKSHVAFPSFAASHDPAPMGYLALIKFSTRRCCRHHCRQRFRMRLTSLRSVDLPDLFSCQTSSSDVSDRRSQRLGHRCPMFDANALSSSPVLTGFECALDAQHRAVWRLFAGSSD